MSELNDNFDVTFQLKDKGHYDVMFEGKSFADVEEQAKKYLKEESLDEEEIIKIERDWHD